MTVPEMTTDYTHPVALVTGAARRIGAVIAETLHSHGFNVVIHCRSSRQEADALASSLEARRPGSAFVVAADLLETTKLPTLAETAAQRWGRLDVLVNNASSFYPTHIGNTSEAEWNDLIGSNLKAPFFLCQACLPHLQTWHGSVVNIIDIHAQRPLAKHAVYTAAKAGLNMLTRSLAKDLGPEVRVNGVAPGAILWPENDISDAEKEAIRASTPLQRTGSPADIADTVMFLVKNTFITGQIIAVDGGRSL